MDHSIRHTFEKARTIGEARQCPQCRTDALILLIAEGQSGVPHEAVALDKRLKGAVHQLLPNLSYGDAISNQAAFIRELLREIGRVPES